MAFRSDRLNMSRLSIHPLVAVALGVALTGAGEPRNGVPAPRLPTDATRWIGTPATWESLRGRVVLLDVWTFG